VLKRCIYGVDINPMAVELAKASLWLDYFTLDVPLSFLDHHLRCGNSLIGVTITEVQEAIDGYFPLSAQRDENGTNPERPFPPTSVPAVAPAPWRRAGRDP
jgi:hypothetical protein